MFVVQELVPWFHWFLKFFVSSWLNQSKQLDPNWLSSLATGLEIKNFKYFREVKDLRINYHFSEDFINLTLVWQIGFLWAQSLVDQVLCKLECFFLDADNFHAQHIIQWVHDDGSWMFIDRANVLLSEA